MFLPTLLQIPHPVWGGGHNSCVLTIRLRGSVRLEPDGVAEILGRKIIEVFSVHLCERIHEISKGLAFLRRVEDHAARVLFQCHPETVSSPPQKNFSHFPASLSTMLCSSIIFRTSAGSAVTQPVPGR